MSNLKKNEGESVQKFFEWVVKFHETFVEKQLKVFDFKSQVLRALAFLDSVKSVTMPTSVFDLIEDNFSLDFDKTCTKLEHREFVCDDNLYPEENCDATSFWLKVHSQISPM